MKLSCFEAIQMVVWIVVELAVYIVKREFSEADVQPEKARVINLLHNLTGHKQPLIPTA